MTPQERDLITGLFERLRSVESGPKDTEAEQFIRSQTAANPSAAYYLVQTLLVEEHALRNAQQRITELERQVAESGSQAAQQPQGVGSFLSKLLHGESSAQRSQVRSGPTQSSMSSSSAPTPPPLPYPSTSNMSAGAGGSFLRTAMGTAAGVAGGALLFQGIQNLLGYHAGPFASGLADFGRGASGQGPEHVDVTNNYYTEELPEHHEPPVSSDSAGSDPLTADDSGYDDAPMDDTFDSGDFGGDDDTIA